MAWPPLLLVLLLVLAPFALADIRVVVSGSIRQQHATTDKPAGFGLPIPDTVRRSRGALCAALMDVGHHFTRRASFIRRQGVRGFLVAASPDMNACSPLVIDKDALRPLASNATAAAPDTPFVVLIRRSPVRAAGTTKDGEGGKTTTARQEKGQEQAVRLSDGRGGYFKRRRDLLGPGVPVAAPSAPATEDDECSFDHKIRNAQAAGAYVRCLWVRWGGVIRWMLCLNVFAPPRGVSLQLQARPPRWCLTRWMSR